MLYNIISYHVILEVLAGEVGRRDGGEPHGGGVLHAGGALEPPGARQSYIHMCIYIYIYM